MRSGALGFLALVATAPFGWFACNYIFGIDEPILAPPVADTGGAVEDTGCGAKWPAAPTSEDGAEDRTFVVALREIDIRVAGPTPLGWDLDGTCTCPEPEACVRRKLSPDAAPHCDEPGGRDVTLNREVLALVTQAEGFSAEALNANLEKGRYGILAEIRGYNGGQNDRAVEIALFISSGVAGDAGPAWDGGGDKWDIDPASLKSGDAAVMVPSYLDKTAYVRDGVLVASKFVGVKIGLGVSNETLDIDLAQSVVTAKIVPRGGGFALVDGTIAGRVTTASLLRAVAPLSAPLIVPPTPLCADSGAAIFAYNYVKGAICNAADLSESADRDKDRGAPCDAVSFGMRFVSEPASLGAIRPRERPDVGCPPSTDDCP